MIYTIIFFIVLLIILSVLFSIRNHNRTFKIDPNSLRHRKNIVYGFQIYQFTILTLKGRWFLLPQRHDTFYIIDDENNQRLIDAIHSNRAFNNTFYKILVRKTDRYKTILLNSISTNKSAPSAVYSEKQYNSNFLNFESFKLDDRDDDVGNYTKVRQKRTPKQRKAWEKEAKKFLSPSWFKKKQVAKQQREQFAKEQLNLTDISEHDKNKSNTISKGKSKLHDETNINKILDEINNKSSNSKSNNKIDKMLKEINHGSYDKTSLSSDHKTETSPSPEHKEASPSTEKETDKIPLPEFISGKHTHKPVLKTERKRVVAESNSVNDMLSEINPGMKPDTGEKGCPDFKPEKKQSSDSKTGKKGCKQSFFKNMFNKLLSHIKNKKKRDVHKGKEVLALPTPQKLLPAPKKKDNN